MKYNKMPHALSGLARLSIALLSLSLARNAHAAPGCDNSTSNVQALGWSPSGLSLLLRHEDFRDCNRKIALEVHNVGATGPAACHDLLAAPEKRIDCGAVHADKLKQPGVSSQEGIYNVPIQSIDPAWIELTYATPSNALGSELNFVVKLSGQDAPLATISARRIANNVHSEDGVLNEPQVAVLPTPDRKQAALLLRGVDTAPGVGHRGWLLRWVPLNGLQKINDSLAPPVDGVKWSVALHILSPLAAADRGKANRDNSAGLKLHTAGQYAAAAELFASAVNADPEGAILARYNLACALTKLGSPEHALRVLTELLTQAPADKITERRTRAQLDEDLAPLRVRPDFQRLVCQGPCAESPVTVSSAVVNISAAGGAPALADQTAPQRNTKGLFGCAFSARPARSGTGLVGAWALLGAALLRRKVRP